MAARHGARAPHPKNRAPASPRDPPARRRPSRFIEIENDYKFRRKTLEDLSRQPSMDSGDDTVPAAAALSFRAAANALQFAMTQRSGRSSSSPGKQRRDGSAAEAAQEPVVDDDATDEELFSAMQGQWVEVECLLRVQLRTEEGIEAAVSTRTLFFCRRSFFGCAVAPPCR